MSSSSSSSSSSSTSSSSSDGGVPSVRRGVCFTRLLWTQTVYHHHHPAPTYTTHHPPNPPPSHAAEDQLEINEFGKLNGKKKELQADLGEVEKRLIGLEEAEEGVMLADESTPGAIKVQVGDCFIDMDGAAASEVVGAALASEKESKARLEEALRALTAKQEALKKKLYARFGSSISLDDPTAQ
jgi:prefoldin subunit 4